jgi:pantoate--beta-alanine ligase
MEKGMRIVQSVTELRKTLADLRRKGKTIGFVPTMGYFHKGHLDLMRKAKKDNDICVVSIYINPTQFGPKEDLAAYPRDFKRDSSLAKKENVDIVFFPTDNAIYPQGYLTYIDVGEVSEGLCGRFRPGHFKGVATVVAKLLNMVQPNVMYLGQKDAQQVAVLQTMVRDLDFPVRIQVVPTRREQDGLAMSSRNVYLSAAERQEATVLFKALEEARKSITKGETSPFRVIARIKKLIDQTSGKVQYIECVDLNSLKALKRIDTDTLIAVAVFFGKTRLIDNVIIRIKKKKSKS